MDIKDRLGIRLKAIRKERGLTQDELASRIDRSVDALSNIERGISLPSFETIEKLSRVLDIPLKTLFDFDVETSSRRKTELLEQLTMVARNLSEADLELGLEQFKALSRRGTKGK